MVNGKITQPLQAFQPSYITRAMGSSLFGNYRPGRCGAVDFYHLRPKKPGGALSRTVSTPLRASDGKDLFEVTAHIFYHFRKNQDPDRYLLLAKNTYFINRLKN